MQSHEKEDYKGTANLQMRGQNPFWKIGYASFWSRNSSWSVQIFISSQDWWTLTGWMSPNRAELWRYPDDAETGNNPSVIHLNLCTCSSRGVLLAALHNKGLTVCRWRWSWGHLTSLWMWGACSSHGFSRMPCMHVWFPADHFPICKKCTRSFSCALLLQCFSSVRRMSQFRHKDALVTG